MKPLVSVVIPAFEDDTYLVRCLNSIRRQTYDNVEILLAGNKCSEKVKKDYGITIISGKSYEDGLNKAIKSSCGEYILFCSVTSILAYSTIETLVAGMKQDSSCIYAVCRTPDKEEFTVSLPIEISLWGKLFRKEKIMEHAIIFDDNYAMPQENFVLRYLGLYEKCVEDDSVEIYETDVDTLTCRRDCGVQEAELETIVKLLRNISLNTKAEFLFNLISDVIIGLSPEQSLKYFKIIAEGFSAEKELNYKIAERYSKNYYVSLLKEKNDRAYEIFRVYLQCFELEREYLAVILDVLGISVEQYEIMQQHDLKEYLFYRNKVYDPVTMQSYVKELQKLQALLEAERKRIDKLENKISTNENMSVKTIKQIQDQKNVSFNQYTGMELAECVVKIYEEGRLGAKTILKSMLAWLKYKMK